MLPSPDEVRRAVDASRPSTLRLFNSDAFFRLWLAQVVSSLGDWIGFFAVAALAARLGGGSPETAISLVLAVRMIPGLFLGTMAGVLADRWNRKHVMVVCDISRGVVLLSLLFARHVWQLAIASLLL
jgi:dTMP kinase